MVTAGRPVLGLLVAALVAGGCVSGAIESSGAIDSSMPTPAPTATTSSASTSPAPTVTPAPPQTDPPPAPAAIVECESAITGADIDYLPDSAGGAADPVVGTKAFLGVRPTDVVAGAGGRTTVIRDDRTIFSGTWFESPDGGWLLAEYDACDDLEIGFAAPRGLVRDAIAEVVVDGGLRVRSLPSVDPASVRYEPLLARGDQLLVVAGPVAADGYEWYQVQSLLMDQSLLLENPQYALVEGDRGPFGWVARASRDGETWIADVEPAPCPVVPGGARRLGVIPEDRLLHCFGSSELAFELDAGQSCGDLEQPGTYDPDWLLGQRCGFLSGDACGWCGLPVAADPDAGVDLHEYSTGYWRISGHFDDPAAATCRQEAPAAGRRSADPDEVVHWCRTIFVLTSVTRLGDSAD